MSSLAGKVCLVSGASKGIGAGIARCFGEQQAIVVVVYATDQAGAERTVAAVNASGGQAWAIQADFSVPADITAAFAAVDKRHGKLDVLVNNAGIASFGALDAVTADEFHRLFNLNVLGVLLATQAAARLMRAAGGGSVINIGAMSGSMPGSHQCIYAATKGAVNNITVSLSKELGAANIRVNVLNPGLVMTEGLEAAGFMKGAILERALKGTPLGRAGQPEDIGKLAVFLASDQSGWLTGQIIMATGGLTI